MKSKPILSLVFCIFSFFSIVAFADTNTIVIGSRLVVVPNYDGFTFNSDPNSPEFKKLIDEFEPNSKTTVHGFYYETTPGDVNKLLALISNNRVPDYITKSEWNSGKTDFLDQEKAPRTTLSGDNKSETVLREAVTNNEFYNTFISETIISSKRGDDFVPVVSILESKTYIYINGKMLVLSITIEGIQHRINSYNQENVNWVKVISDATAQKILELNPPTQETLQAEERANTKEQLRHWKHIILIVLGVWLVIVTYFFDYLPTSVQNRLPRFKKKFEERQKKKQEAQQKRKGSAIERQK